MKKLHFMTVIIMVLTMVLAPMTVLPKVEKEMPATPESSSPSEITVPPTEASSDGGEFLVFHAETETVVKMAAKDYVWGVVAAEMPAEYKEEALKAQAVAAYTYASRKRQKRLEGSVSQDYDVTTSPSVDQCYISKEAAAEKWGEEAPQYTLKIENAVSSVLGRLITYDGSPILSVYHAISSGKTETAKNVWGTQYPYLVSVESVGDMLSKGYLEEKTVEIEEFKAAFADKNCNFDGDSSEFAKIAERSDCGTVIKASVGGVEMSGSDIRMALSLRSANFDVEAVEGGIKFTTRGYGHGVGMSQNGANYMAMQGSDFEEILRWYYPGCEIKG